MYILCTTGDCAIVSSFTSYLGPFNKEFRQLLVDRDLRSACTCLAIPVTPNLNVASFLVEDAEVAEWTAQASFDTVNNAPFAACIPHLCRATACTNQWDSYQNC